MVCPVLAAMLWTARLSARSHQKTIVERRESAIGASGEQRTRACSDLDCEASQTTRGPLWSRTDGRNSGRNPSIAGVGGAYVGNETTGQAVASSRSSSSTTSSRYDSTLVRTVQQALNDKGYNAGSIDGQWGPTTEDAVRRFQQASGLPQTGELERSTLAALGVAPTK